VERRDEPCSSPRVLTWSIETRGRSGVLTIRFDHGVQFPYSTRNERWVYTVAVYSVLFFGFVHSGTCIATVYIMVVDKFGDVAQMASCPWSFAVDPVLT